MAKKTKIEFEKVTDLKIFQATEAGVSFVLTFDGRFQIWSVSYKQPGRSPNVFVGENVHPETGKPFFKTRYAAEAACVDVLKQIKQPN